MMQRIQRQPYAAGVLRRAITVLISLAWITSSLACPLPTLAYGDFAQIGHSAGSETRGHEHRYAHGTGGDNHHSDLCCDILGHSYSAVESANSPLKNAAVPDHAPMLLVASFLVAATPTDEAINPPRHGPGPSPRPWPQFTKVWSQAPPAKRN